MPPLGVSSNIALWRANIKPPFEMVVGDLGIYALNIRYTANLTSQVDSNLCELFWDFIMNKEEMVDEIKWNHIIIVR